MKTPWLLLSLLAALPLWAAELEIPHTRQQVRIDGQLDDPVWQQALHLQLDYETRPGENTPAPEKTDFWVAEDGQRLLLAFHAHDSNPEAIVAHLHDRDEFWEDDFVGVLLDTFNDERRAYQFFVNPLGVQAEATLDDTRRNSDDPSWNALWDSAARRVEDGYVVEMAIPFSSINMPRPQGQPLTWGMEAIRYLPRAQVHRLSIQPVDRNRNCQVCQFAKFTGFREIEQGLDLELTPTITVAQRRGRENADGPMRTDKPDAEAGLDINWGISPNLTLNATLNPDFSQIEADSVQVDVNTTFALFFPEKRPFFLENADYFAAPSQLIYTRNVADPDIGIKLTGKNGPHQYGFFASNDTVTSFFVPNPEGSSLASLDSGSLAVAGRYRYEATPDLTLGLVTTYRSANDYYSGLLGADLRWNINERDRLQLQWVESQSEYPDSIVSSYELTGPRLSGGRYQFRFNHRGRNRFYWTAITRNDPGYRADLGFLRRVNLDRFAGGGGYDWINPDGQAWWSRFGVSTRNWMMQRADNARLLERNFQLRFEFEGAMQTKADWNFIRRTTVYQGQVFPRDFMEGEINFRPHPRLQLGLEAQLGDDVDYTHIRPATRNQFRPYFSLNLGTGLKVDFSHLRQDLDVSGGRLYRLDLGELRAKWQFTSKAYLRLISQYRKLQRNPALYADAVDRNYQSLSNQLLFGYKLDAKSVAFLGYSDQGFSDDEVPDRVTMDQTVFVKLGYTF